MAQICTRVSVSKTLDEMTESEVLAMALDDMEFLGLIKWKPDADKKPTPLTRTLRHMANDMQSAA